MISVIVPLYYGNRYIENLVQVLKRNKESLKELTGEILEVVFVNDSPDEVIPDEVLTGLTDVKVVTNRTNCGIHASRVNGLMKSSGDYVFFLDQDDQIDDNYVVSQLQHIKDYDFVISNGFEQDCVGNTTVLYRNDKEQMKCLSLSRHYYRGNAIRSPGQVLLKKDIIPTKWQTVILQNNGCDDAFLWILLLEQKARGTINPERIYTHIDTGENAGHNANGMMLSQLEMAENMRGNTKRLNILAIKRRAKYLGKYKNSILYKLKYIDVVIARKLFKKGISCKWALIGQKMLEGHLFLASLTRLLRLFSRL